MGTPAEPIPVSQETQDLVQQTEPATLAEVADTSNAGPEQVNAEWFVVRQKGTKNFLAELDTPAGTPYPTSASYGPFGARTYFYDDRADADGVAASSDAEVVPIKISATLSYS